MFNGHITIHFTDSILSSYAVDRIEIHLIHLIHHSERYPGRSCAGHSLETNYDSHVEDFLLCQLSGNESVSKALFLSEADRQASCFVAYP